MRPRPPIARSAGHPTVPAPQPMQPQEPATLAQRLARAREVIRIEARTIAELEHHLDARFSEAVGRVLACQGFVVVTGMGKAGLVGQKVSATLASTGTPSHFLHPGEALHGDLGRIRRSDVLLALSNSGETDEVIALLGPARKLGAEVIAVTGRPESTLARLSDCVLEIGTVREACPLELAPTASTSAMLALGDALAMTVLAERGFGREDYALYHPAGALGRRLMRVREVMRQGEYLPLVQSGSPLAQVLITMTQTPGRPGAALVVGADGRLAGIFTDGDVRRILQGGTLDVTARIDDLMGRHPKSIGPEQLVEEAQRLLQENRIDQVPVLDAEGRPIGLLDVQDLLDIRI